VRLPGQNLTKGLQEDKLRKVFHHNKSGTQLEEFFIGSVEPDVKEQAILGKISIGENRKPYTHQMVI
jgi:hypothetical protein